MGVHMGQEGGEKPYNNNNPSRGTFAPQHDFCREECERLIKFNRIHRQGLRDATLSKNEQRGGQTLTFFLNKLVVRESLMAAETLCCIL